MYDQQQASPGGQPRSLACYNCGEYGHFMVACPESIRQVPAGLAASFAVSSQDPGDDFQGVQSRPSKRQKTGPSGTKYTPSSGPVVTRYAPPPNAAPTYRSQPYYGAHPAASYQPPPPPSQYTPPSGISQPSVGYQSYAQNGLYGLPNSGQQYGQAHPATYRQSQPAISQGYGQSQITGPQGYAATQSYGQAVPDAGHYQYTHYSSDTAGQTYGYQLSQQYPSQSSVGQSPQNYPPYHQGPPQPPLTYGNTPQPQLQQPDQQWGQSIPAYSAPQNPTGNYAYQQPYSGMHHEPLHKTGFQAPHGGPNYQRPTYASHPVSLNNSQEVPSSSYNTLENLQQYPATSGPSINLGVSFRQDQVQASPHVPSKAEIAAEDVRSRWEELQWDMEKIFSEEEHTPAIVAARPLPNSFADDLLIAPVPGATGVISKYVRANNLHVYSLGIRKSLHWAFFRKDPSFDDINFESPLIPLGEVGAWMAEQQNGALLTIDAQSVENDARSMDDNSGDIQFDHHPHFESNEAGDHTFDAQADDRVLPSVETSGTERSRTPCFQLGTPDHDNCGTPALETGDDVWAPQPGESIVANSSAVEQEDPTEILLASLGVTGAPKPVLQRTPSLSVPPGAHLESMMDGYGRQPSRQDSGYASARGSYSNGSTNASDYGVSHGTRQVYNETQPPPPPPPFARKQCDISMETNDPDRVQYGGLHDQHHSHNGAAQGASPLTSSSSDLLNLEKPIATYHPDGKKPEPLRQVDDVTPKLKRRQPKVADAYSRRW